ncbi:MAG: hypothetical protein KIT44_14955 [Opitutaceae bacterium]|nr:hypothetical protein [Opitutaceae bacterium]
MEYVSRTKLAHEPAIDYSLLGGEHIRRGQRLFTTGMAILAAALVYLGYTANTQNPLHTFQGLLILTLAVVPALLWAKTGGSRFPVFEAIMLLCANAYGLPLLNAKEQLAAYSDDVITRAGWTVVLYLTVAIASYRMVRGLPGRSSFWTESLITPRIERLVVYGMLVSAAYVSISVFTDWIPWELVSILRAVFFGLGILCTFVSAQRWGRGGMTQGEKAIFLCAIVPQVVFLSTGLLLIGSISQIGIALLGYLSGGKRIPWLVIVATFSILAVLHAGKSKMREKYWEGDLPPPTFTQLPAFYSEWFGYGLQKTEEAEGKAASNRLLERTSLMHILCLIESYTPVRQDYLYGATYRHVLPQLIPRFFWPEKPRSHVSTYELSIYYGLQSEEATETTTIAFGLLAEAYANFGMFGSVMLGLFWGVTLKKLQIWTTFSPMFSFAGLIMILLTAWAFNSELTMAAWISSLQQAVVVVVGIPFVLKRLVA